MNTTVGSDATLYLFSESLQPRGSAIIFCFRLENLDDLLAEDLENQLAKELGCPVSHVNLMRRGDVGAVRVCWGRGGGAVHGCSAFATLGCNITIDGAMGFLPTLTSRFSLAAFILFLSACVCISCFRSKGQEVGRTWGGGSGRSRDGGLAYTYVLASKRIQIKLLK